MPVDPAAIGAATLSLTQSVTLFQTLLPKLTEVSRADPSDAEFVRDVRVGELGAVSLAIGIGAMASAITGSSAPAVVAVISCAGLVFMYESALKGNVQNVSADA